MNKNYSPNSGSETAVLLLHHHGLAFSDEFPCVILKCNTVEVIIATYGSGMLTEVAIGGIGLVQGTSACLHCFFFPSSLV